MYRDLTALPPGPDAPRVIHAIVEIQQDGSNKYEYDAELGLFKLDRVLYSAVHYPMAYGFIPGTLADDGDPIDVMVMTRSPTFTGCLILAKPIGLFRMHDEKGEDEKILAVPTADPRFNEVESLEDMRPHRLREVEHFFSIYKDLEDKKVDIRGWESRESAYKAIEQSIERRAAKFGPNG
ncbi:MAG: inorganic pyrophosphatase [Acidobacteria bacterium]|nr:inorganic pyrophosphatase [Acidobacteriota bacterium]